jgi:hypothetical protein
MRIAAASYITESGGLLSRQLWVHSTIGTHSHYPVPFAYNLLMFFYAWRWRIQKTNACTGTQIQNACVLYSCGQSHWLRLTCVWANRSLCRPFREMVGWGCFCISLSFYYSVLVDICNTPTLQLTGCICHIYGFCVYDMFPGLTLHLSPTVPWDVSIIFSRRIIKAFVRVCLHDITSYDDRYSYRVIKTNCVPRNGVRVYIVGECSLIKTHPGHITPITSGQTHPTRIACSCVFCLSAPNAKHN